MDIKSKLNIQGKLEIVESSMGSSDQLFLAQNNGSNRVHGVEMGANGIDGHFRISQIQSSTSTLRWQILNDSSFILFGSGASVSNSQLRIVGTSHLPTAQNLIDFHANGWGGNPAVRVGGGLNGGSQGDFTVWTTANYNTTAPTESFRILGNGGQIKSLPSYSITSSSPANMYIHTDGRIHRSTSSKRYKKNINYEGVDWTKALELKPVSYIGTGEVDGDELLGFVAEDVYAVEPRLVQIGTFNREDIEDNYENVIEDKVQNGKIKAVVPDAVHYSQITALNNAAIQEMYKIILGQQKQIDDLNEQVIELKAL